MKKAILLMGLVIFPAVLFAANYDEGISYQTIVPAQPTASKDKIEVVELFWYGCPHCHRFEPFIERWLKNKTNDVEFIRIPAILRESWAIHSRAYYTAEALGALDKIHKSLFTAIHTHKRKLNTEQALMTFFAEQGISNDDFRKAFKSFSVDAKVRRAREMGRRYGVSGTPSMVINGKYRTDGTICKCGFSEVINIVDFLTAKERASLAKN